MPGLQIFKHIYIYIYIYILCVDAYQAYTQESSEP